MRMPGTRRPSRRPLAVFAAVVAIALVFLGKLVTVQVVQAAELNRESKDKRSIVRAVPGARGSITDASGRVLARSVLRYTVTASPKLATARSPTRARSTARPSPAQL